MKTTQTGWIIIVGLLGGLIICSGAIFRNGLSALDFNLMLVCIIILLTLIICIILMYRLSIIADEKGIRFRMGIGLIRRSFDYNKIADIREVKNNWWSGWGIRLNPYYTIYNVSGLKAIEIEFKNRKRKVRIGTDEPERIVEYVKKYLK